MERLGLIPICFLAGILLKRLGITPPGASIVLNRFVLYLSLPALTLHLIHSMHLDSSSIYPVMMAWIFFALAVVFFSLLGRVMGWGKGTVGALVLTAGLGNTSFLGYPIIEALYGKEGLATAVLIDQPGSFLVLGTLGIFAASFYSGYSGKEFNARHALRKVILFPPLFCVAVALLLRPWPYPAALDEALSRIGATLVPIALVSVGMQLELDLKSLRAERVKLIFGLLFKLLLAPAAIAVLYRMFGVRGQTLDVTILEAAMAPMITGAILASEYGLGSALTSLMIGVGIPLSLVTVSIWYRFI